MSKDYQRYFRYSMVAFAMFVLGFCMVSSLFVSTSWVEKQGYIGAFLAGGILIGTYILIDRDSNRG